MLAFEIVIHTKIQDMHFNADDFVLIFGFLTYVMMIALIIDALEHSTNCVFYLD